LRTAIVNAELEPGEKLSENELSNLGVSRTPIRAALARLSEERLVAIVPQLGTFVTLISEEAVGDAVFVREALEGAAARLVAQAGEIDFSELQANLAAQADAIATHDAKTFDELDKSFHETICDLAGKRIAWTLSRRANGQLDRLRTLSLPRADYLAQMLEQHRRTAQALADRGLASTRAWAPRSGPRAALRSPRTNLTRPPALTAECCFEAEATLRSVAERHRWWSGLTCDR